MDPNPLSLKGRVALITGAGQGIGAAIARVFAEAGAYVALVDRDGAGVANTAQQVGLKGGDAVCFDGDVTDAFAMERIVDRVADDCGRLDILINNAGIVLDARLEDVVDADWNQVLDVNLRGAVVCARAVIPHMLANRWGRIVSAASIVARTGNFGQTAYAASKAGIVGLTRTWAREFGPRGITANAVAPGFIETAMVQGVPARVMTDLIKRTPARRLGRPEEAANVYLLLASEAGSYINGAVVGVDGGLLL